MSKVRKKPYAGIKPVTRDPCFIMKIKGVIDSKKGEPVVLSRIRKLKDRCVAIESRECMITENELAGVRMQAAAALSALSLAKEQTAQAGTAKTKHCVSEVREKQKLYLINEKLCHADVILDERILKTRMKACVKIDAYVTGLRKGAMASFDPAFEFSDDARDAYHARHSELDTAVCKYASFKEG